MDGGDRAVGILLGWGTHTPQRLWNSDCPLPEATGISTRSTKPEA